MIECAKMFLNSGVEWLLVNGLWEAEVLRKNNINAPIYVFGYVPLPELNKLNYLKDVQIACYNNETFEYLGENNINA